MLNNFRVLIGIFIIALIPQFHYILVPMLQRGNVMLALSVCIPTRERGNEVKNK